jgi:hypothetical protein
MTLEVRQPGGRPPSCAPREGHRSFIRSTRCMRQPGTAYHRVVSVLPFAPDWGPRLGHARDVGSPIEYAAQCLHELRRQAPRCACKAASTPGAAAVRLGAVRRRSPAIGPHERELEKGASAIRAL